jgi:hypothetical protein
MRERLPDRPLFANDASAEKFNRTPDFARTTIRKGHNCGEMVASSSPAPHDDFSGFAWG